MLPVLFVASALAKPCTWKVVCFTTAVDTISGAITPYFYEFAQIFTDLWYSYPNRFPNIILSEPSKMRWRRPPWLAFCSCSQNTTLED